DSEAIASSAKSRAAEAAELSKRVGLSEESLGATEEEIIESARLDGWTEAHPDISSIGYPDRRFEPMVEPDVVKRLFTQSQVLRDQGWRFEMLERRLTEDEDAPYKKLYRMTIPDAANPPIPTNSPEDTVQALYTEDDELLISFDPEVLEWYPSVVIPLPQHDLFACILGEIQQEISSGVRPEITQLFGQASDLGIKIWQENH
ncbi:helicase, partial [Halolamina salina]